MSGHDVGIPSSPARPVVLFDGDCVLCSGTAHFLMKHDSREVFLFSTVQSAWAADLRTRHPEWFAKDTIILAMGDTVLVESAAVLAIARLMGFPYALAGMLIVVPPFLRDTLYRFIARHRYRLFGRRDECYMAPPALRARVLP
ncbi:MAG: thiol-disulfide oxidoreductase DCC family protein [Candidatus Kapaibacterium sp.]